MKKVESAPADAPSPPDSLVLRTPEVALAAVAAAFAFFAQVIGAGVLGAVDADFGGRLVADAALERSGLSHGYSLAYFAFCGDAGVTGGAGLGAAVAGRAGGWRISVPRQRCASRSTT
jgi:hypothetical protein